MGEQTNAYTKNVVMMTDELNWWLFVARRQGRYWSSMQDNAQNYDCMEEGKMKENFEWRIELSLEMIQPVQIQSFENEFEIPWGHPWLPRLYLDPFLWSGTKSTSLCQSNWWSFTEV